jgi:MYXO-CTERM domain-containing protein
MEHTPRTVGLGIAAALALSLGCGTAPEPASQGAPQPIISGDDSKDKQFPTVVGLLLDAYGIDQMNPNPLMPKCVRGNGVCTGSLIREDVILTASHCVVNLLKQIMDPSCQKDPEAPKYTFEVDLIGAARGMRVTGTVKAVAHPNFAPTMCTNPPTVDRWNDIALVFLKDPVKGVPIQKIAKPADAPTLLKEGSKVRIVGYGKSKIDDDMTAGTQRWGTATLAKVGDYEIQAGQLGEQQACQGDSGGPVLANPDGTPDEMVQIGVASRLRTLKCASIWDLFNPPKCENGVFYTRVDAFYDWIQQTIEKERPIPVTDDMRKPDAPDLAAAEEPDLAQPTEEMPPPPPDENGCKCSVGGHGAVPASPLLLLGGLLLARLARRRRR